MNQKTLEERLIRFSVSIVKLSEKIRKTHAGIALIKQIVRSGTSPALNYGEAMSAESRKDFVHKLQILTKELRETFINLKIIKLSELVKAEQIDPIIAENNELISIFVATINTAKKKH